MNKVTQPVWSESSFCQAVLSTIGALVVVLDTRGRIVYFNRACEQTTGFRSAAVRGRLFFELFLTPEEAPAVRRTFARLKAGAFPNEHENDWLTRRGERRRIAWRNTAILDAHGRVSHVVGTGIDITARRLIEQRIECAKQEWERTFDAVPDLIAIVDNDGRIMRANRTLARRLRKPVTALIGRRCCAELHGLRRRPADCAHRAMLADGREHTLERHEKRLGGDFAISVTPLRDASGAPRGSVHVFRDITALKRAADDLRRARDELDARVHERTAELATALRRLQSETAAREQAQQEAARRREELALHDRVNALGLLSASLAHELNQPLAGILSNAQAALSFLARQPPDLEEIRGILADIVEDNRRASAVIRGIRTLLRPQAETRSPVPLDHIAQAAINLMRNNAAARKIRLDSDCARRLPPVAVNETQILQVLTNLLLNAFDAVETRPPDRRRVTIGLKPARHGAGAVFSVRDTGPGIPPDRIATIFEPFQTSKPMGMGMGLSIARSIVEAHGGRLQAENRPRGGGAVFTFDLPGAAG